LIAAILLLSIKAFHKALDYGAGMKFNLNEDGSKYMRLLGTKFGFVLPRTEQ
jgi:hypothetical protein